MAGFATRRALLLLAAGTVVFGLAQVPALGTMRDHGAGVIEFELARSSERAAEIVSDWGPDGRSAARQQLLLDYPYLVCYGLFLAGACTAVAARARRRGMERLAALGGILAACGLAAAGFDALENAALLLVAGEHTDQPWPGLAFGAAVLKFALSGAAALYALGGWLATWRTAAG